jgi:ribose transport system ATP-binding protein
MSSTQSSRIGAPIAGLRSEPGLLLGSGLAIPPSGVLPSVPSAAEGVEEPAQPAVPVLDVRGIAKSFEATQALKGVDFRVVAGEIVGIVGHNGAGKSTLVKAIVGLIDRDGGEVTIGGARMPSHYSIRVSRQHGVSLALQEISLCPDLRVEENIGIAHPELIGPGWRRRARSLVDEHLSAVFPRHGISPRAVVSWLSLAQRQMLQIAMATVTVGSPIRLLILDEPTSALRDEFSDNLFAYLREQTQNHGLSVLLVSHKMNDIVGGHTDRTVVMRDGRVAAEHSSVGLTVDSIIESMGGAPAAKVRAAGPSRVGHVETRHRGAPDAADVLTVRGLDSNRLRHVSLRVPRGAIVGLAGLEGNGQRDVLHAVWRARKRGLIPSKLHRAVTVKGRLSYLSGDRQKEGIFPLWALRENLTVSVLQRLRVFGLLSIRAERQEAFEWISQLSIRGAIDTPVLALSGGTQQKVLLARGLAVNPDLLLLDDPFRGVDITTKMDAYRRLHGEAEAGRSTLWYTTENTELLECDVVYVLRHGEVVATLSGEDLCEARIIASSFETIVGEQGQS